MPPVDAVQCQVHEGLEPWGLEDGRQVGILIALPVHDAEALVQDVAFALPYAAGEVHVHFHVAIYVVQRHTVGIVHIDGILPGIAPGAQVLFGQRFGL